MSGQPPQIVPAFFNHLPVRVRFGHGVAHELPEIVAATGARRALLVSDADLDDLTERALADFFITPSPAPWSATEVRAAFAAALALAQR